MKSWQRFTYSIFGCLFVMFSNIGYINAMEHSSFVVSTPKKVDVKLERIYLDGEIGEEFIKETFMTMEDFWSYYNEWTVVEQNEEMIHLRKEVHDISPLLKLNGYFGLSDDGYLNIYNGKPNDDNVIHSFFQINTAKLKSHQHLELQEGIPVISRENYQDILKVFKQYAITEL